MNKLFNAIWLCPALVGILVSCAALPPAAGENPPENATRSAAFTHTSSAEKAPEKPVIPRIPEYIMGTGIASAKDLSSFLLSVNTAEDKSFIEGLAFIYIEEAAAEGVNHDVAFAQMCLETGFLRYGNLVTPDQNNFCGLGAIGPGQSGERFPTPRIGVRAHVQHLKAYATDAPLNQELVDPRYRFVRLGSSPAIKGLAGTWAADRNYAEKIGNILNNLYNHSFGS